MEMHQRVFLKSTLFTALAISVTACAELLPQFSTDDYERIEPFVPDISCADVPESAQLITVSQTGGADHATIMAAVVEAEAVGNIHVIAVDSGDYREAIEISGQDIYLCAEENVTVTNDSDSFGLRISGSNVVVDGVQVMDIHHETFPEAHGPSGVVVSGRNVVLNNVSSQNNGVNGIIVLAGSDSVAVVGGELFNNGMAGLALAGGERIRVEGTRIFNANTGKGAGRQQYGVLSDNVGDTTGSGNQITSIDHSMALNDVHLNNVDIRNHTKYGIRLSVENAELSQLTSGRITTRNLTLSNSVLVDNGSATDNFVGGLYHHGNVLLQHIEGGLLTSNRFEGGYTWGVDVYGSNHIEITDNLFLNNNRGEQTAGVTIAPYGIEINGGHSNLFQHNLVYGNTNGLFSSFFPDSGDQFNRAADQYDSYSGHFSLTVRNNIIVENTGVFTNAEGDVETGVDVEWFDQQAFTRTYTNNVIHTVPAFVGGSPTVLGSNFATENPYYDVPVASIFVDAAAGNFNIQTNSPLADKNIGPRSLMGDRRAQRDLHVYFAGHSGINDAIPAYTATISQQQQLGMTEKHCQIGGGFLDWQFDTNGNFPCNQWEDFPGSGNLGEEFVSNPTDQYDAIVLVENSSYGDLRQPISADPNGTPKCNELTTNTVLDRNQRIPWIQRQHWGGEGDPWTSPAFMQLAFDVAHCFSSQPIRLYFFNHWDDDFGLNAENLRTVGVYREQLTSWADYWEQFVDRLNRPNLRIIPAARALERLIQAMENGTAPGFENETHDANGKLLWANYLVHNDSIHLTNAGLYYLSLVAFATLHEVPPEDLALPTNAEGESVFGHNSFGGNDGVLVESNRLPISTNWQPDSRGDLVISTELRRFMQQLAWQVAQDQMARDASRRGE